MLKGRTSVVFLTVSIWPSQNSILQVSSESTFTSSSLTRITFTRSGRVNSSFVKTRDKEAKKIKSEISLRINLKISVRKWFMKRQSSKRIQSKLNIERYV